MSDEPEVFTSDDDSDDSSEIATPFVIQRPGRRKKTDLSDKPIENADEIPLFHDADKRGLTTASYLRIFKIDAPNHGFKGDIPLNSTLQTISQLYGNGIYNIEVLNSKHQVLRSKENVKISLEAPLSTNKPNNPTESELIRTVLSSKDGEADRIAKIALGNVEESKRQSREYTDLVKSTMVASAERDRAFMSGQNKNQQEFFANLMLAQNQMFQQTMAIITMGHQHTIEALRASIDRDRNSSKESVELLLKGMMLGKDINGDQDSPDWLRALHSGENMLTKLLQLKADTKVEPENKTVPGDKSKIPLTKNELLEVIRLKKILSEKGIDFSELVKQAREEYSKQDETSESSDSKEVESPESA